MNTILFTIPGNVDTHLLEHTVLDERVLINVVRHARLIGIDLFLAGGHRRLITTHGHVCFAPKLKLAHLLSCQDAIARWVLTNFVALSNELVHVFAAVATGRFLVKLHREEVFDPVDGVMAEVVAAQVALDFFKLNESLDNCRVL